MSKKTVFLIIPEMEMGGAQRSMANLSLELEKYYNVFLIVFNHTYEIPFKHGGTLLNLNVAGGRNASKKIFNFFRRVLTLKKFKKKHAPAVSISFLEGADYINLLSRLQDKIVYSIRGSKINDETINGKIGRLRHKLLLPFFLRKADEIVVVNKGIKAELIDFYKVNQELIKVIPNFYDLEAIQKLANEPLANNFSDFFSQSKILVMSGRLAVEKGQRYIINLLPSLKKKLPGVKLVLLGHGPEYENLKEICKVNDLSHSNTPAQDIDVLFLPKEDNIYKYLNHSDLYIMCSSSEGFPNGLCEAMACGLPVVSSDCPYGPREILAPSLINNEFGILLPVFQRREDYDYCFNTWELALVDFLRDDNLIENYKLRSLKRIRDFTKSSALEKWNQIIEDF